MAIACARTIRNEGGTSDGAQSPAPPAPCAPHPSSNFSPCPVPSFALAPTHHILSILRPSLLSARTQRAACLPWLLLAAGLAAGNWRGTKLRPAPCRRNSVQRAVTSEASVAAPVPKCYPPPSRHPPFPSRLLPLLQPFALSRRYRTVPADLTHIQSLHLPSTPYTRPCLPKLVRSPPCPWLFHHLLPPPRYFYHTFIPVLFPLAPLELLPQLYGVRSM